MTDSPPKQKKLNAKQKAFIEAYFAYGMNASEAARRAGYTNRPNTAASQLMSNNVIRAEMDRIQRENAMPVTEVLARLSEQARADIEDVVGFDGLLNMSKARERGKTGIIKSISHTTTTFKGVTTTTIKVDLHDSQKALQLLGKYHKLFVDRVQVDDWRSQAIQDIKDGTMDYETLKEAFDEEEAQNLFRAAGMPIVIGDSDDPSSISD